MRVSAFQAFSTGTEPLLVEGKRVVTAKGRRYAAFPATPFSSSLAG